MLQKLTEWFTSLLIILVQDNFDCFIKNIFETLKKKKIVIHEILILIFHLLVLSRTFHVSLETVVLCIFLRCDSSHWRFIHPFQLSQLGLIISQIALQGWEAQFQAKPNEYMILSALSPWSPPASLELGYGVLPDDHTLTKTFVFILHLFQPFCVNVLKAFWRHDREAG